MTDHLLNELQLDLAERKHRCHNARNRRHANESSLSGQDGPAATECLLKTRLLLLVQCMSEHSVHQSAAHT